MQASKQHAGHERENTVATFYLVQYTNDLNTIIYEMNHHTKPILRKCTSISGTENITIKIITMIKKTIKHQVTYKTTYHVKCYDDNDDDDATQNLSLKSKPYSETEKIMTNKYYDKSELCLSEV